MSQKYKDSSSCREEAEYAADQKKNIIPLKMQEDYKADGWLGIITAGKLWYDFSDEDQFEHKFQELMTAVREIIGGDASCDTVDAPVVEQPIVAARVKPIMAQHAGASAVAPSPRQPATSIDIQKIKAWTPKDVEAWRNKVGLTGPKFQRLTGKELVASKSFFKTAKKDLQLDLSDVSELSDALDQLPFA
ncbi:hypothetical protein BaRGS_00036527 [Batillaria attramentaria]|uniref:TIR domain-containing protein n=1 Tax=Batillaria attramentaria TaxID=370345 RepID=A0ABD0JC51_9CAEN